MELFTQLFGDLLAFVYHCFDRIVIYGYLSGLSRPEQVVHFFRNGVGVATVSKDVLSQPICVRCLGSVQFVADSPLEGAGFELVWGFSCQVVVFGFLPVLCSELESRSSSRRLRSGSRSARKGSRDRNASTAWRLAA